jgi:hypothetical protein
MADEPMIQDAGLTEEWDHPGRYAGMAQESEIGPRPGSLEAVAIMHQLLENQEREAQWEMQQAVENRRHGEEVAVPTLDKFQQAVENLKTTGQWHEPQRQTQEQSHDYGR